jgi:hypothetical protein
MGFYIKRPLVKAQIDQQDRWLTPSGGWSSNFRAAHRFINNGTAAFQLRERSGEIVEIRACRRCNCTELDACLDSAGPCSWVENDLCSACLTPRERKRWLNGENQPSGGLP